MLLARPLVPMMGMLYDPGEAVAATLNVMGGALQVDPTVAPSVHDDAEVRPALHDAPSSHTVTPAGKTYPVSSENTMSLVDGWAGAFSVAVSATGPVDPGKVETRSDAGDAVTVKFKFVPTVR
ncbi:hypothetical protein A3C91_01615 [Candidatus Azambacteria bacterium RIFCSPHIGHO2_02_FULL_52_12]|nr:MAG: hypothetical protein A3C91_01615 [Candidatus Azambacteria bacterium RIFCSPHIGHO2_02_FULL_52_12]